MTSVDGIYYSGGDSQPRPVKLTRVGEYLRLEGPKGARDIPLVDIETEAPLAGMPRNMILPSGALIEVPGDADVDDWFGSAGLLERIVNWLEVRWPVAIASLAVTAVASWAIYAFALPAAATAAANAMPMSWKHSISDQSVEMLRQLGFFSSDIPEERQAAIRTRFAPLIEALPNPEQYNLEFRKARFLGPNAFAMPGGRMVVLDDLVELTDRDEEIIAVLAHELGHAYHQHPMRLALQSGALSILVTLAIGDASGLAALPLISLNATYSRGFEEEADTFAIQALQGAGLSPQELANIFTRLRDEMEMDGNGGSLLSSHPALNERIERAAAAADAP